MNVKDLKNLVKNLPDDAQVLIWEHNVDEDENEAFDVSYAEVTKTPDAALHLRFDKFSQ